MISREERDLIVRWIRGMRREPLPPRCRRALERQAASLLKLDPRTLPSVPSPRAALR